MLYTHSIYYIYMLHTHSLYIYFIYMLHTCICVCLYTQLFEEAGPWALASSPLLLLLHYSCIPWDAVNEQVCAQLMNRAVSCSSLRPGGFGWLRAAGFSCAHTASTGSPGWVQTQSPGDSGSAGSVPQCLSKSLDFDESPLFLRCFFLKLIIPVFSLVLVGLCTRALKCCELILWTEHADYKLLVI